MAEDILKKSAIIEAHVMERKIIGKSIYYAVVTPLRKAASYEQRKTNL